MIEADPPPPGPLQNLQGDPPSQRRMRRRQSRRVDLEAPPSEVSPRVERSLFVLDDLRRRRVRRLVQPVGIVAGDRRAAGESVGDCRREVLGEERDQPVPHAVAQDALVAVGRVLAMRQAAQAQVAAKLVPTDVEQGAHDGGDAGSDAGQAGRPGAADQPQQHRLGLVVAGVSGGHAVGPPLPHRPREQRVANPVPRRLDRDPLRPRACGHVDALDGDGDPERCGDVAAERFVLVGRRPPQTMVDVQQSGNRPARSGRQLAQEGGERHRVATAGAGHQHAHARRKKRLALKGLPDAPCEW